MNAEIQKVPASFKVVKWGIPPDKLDQLADLHGLTSREAAYTLATGQVPLRRPAEAGDTR